MATSKPVPQVIIRDDFTTGAIEGGSGNDHLIHHRNSDVQGHATTEMSGFGGDDILEGSVPVAGQIHMFGGRGDDWLILDVTKSPDAKGIQGHHVYGGYGENTYQFTNLADNEAPIVGRLDDFNPTTDRILIEDTEIDLMDLPQVITLSDGSKVEVSVIEVDHPAFLAEDLGTQYFLSIGDDILYALEGARDLSNGTTGLTGEETHFIDASALETLRSAEPVQYENPDNFVPHEFYAHREDELNLNANPSGAEVKADTGDKDAAHISAGKGNEHDHVSDGTRGEQLIRGSDGDDVIDANTGYDSILGGKGADLIAGGIDNDHIDGGGASDILWGGDGDDTLVGGWGNDLLQGGRGDDELSGGEGDDTIFGGEGDDTLTGGGGPDAVNRFHFYEDSGRQVITDFKAGSDLITLQDDIDPLTVEIYENDAGNTVINQGSEGSIELMGVTLTDFQTAAEERAEAGKPIITITPDPEEEMLQEFRAEIGYYGNASPPSLLVDGVDYGAAAFTEPEAGGYRYVSEHEGYDDLNDHEDHEENGDGKDESSCTEESGGTYDHCDPIIPDVPADYTAERDEEVEDVIPDTTCFVATAAYNDPGHPDVIFLRAFRDKWLVNRAWGRSFIALYWRVGPPLAGCVRRNPRLSKAARHVIAAIVRVLQMLWKA